MLPNNCITCIWWDSEHESIKEVKEIDMGYCCKKKPIPFGKGERYYGEWPLVHKLRGCGEHKGSD